MREKVSVNSSYENGDDAFPFSVEEKIGGMVQMESSSKMVSQILGQDLRKKRKDFLPQIGEIDCTQENIIESDLREFSNLEGIDGTTDLGMSSKSVSASGIYDVKKFNT